MAAAIVRTDIYIWWGIGFFGIGIIDMMDYDIKNNS